MTRYEIPAGGDPAKWLTVDKNTGEVTAIAEMDRESPYVNNSIYSVIVLAVDDGKQRKILNILPLNQ